MPIESSSEKRSIEATVLFEDEHFLVVNKPAPLNVHPTPARPHETSLETEMKKRFQKDLILLHRLDRDTTGIVMFAKRREVAGEMTKLFADKKIRKSYLAVVEGKWDPSCNRIDQPVKIGEETKNALTTFRLLASQQQKSWLEVLPKTGRKHQIRLHCLSVGHAILGDKLYHPERTTFDIDLPPHALHAHRLDFRHPVTGAMLAIRAEPPDYWRTHWLVGLEVDSIWKKLFST